MTKEKKKRKLFCQISPLTYEISKKKMLYKQRYHRLFQPKEYVYHIFTEGEIFAEKDGVIYQLGKVYRKTVDRVTGNTVDSILIKDNHAKVMYDLKYTTLNKQ